MTWLLVMGIPVAKVPIRVTQQSHTYLVKHPVSLKSGFPIFSEWLFKMPWFEYAYVSGGEESYSFY